MVRRRKEAKKKGDQWGLTLAHTHIHTRTQNRLLVHIQSQDMPDSDQIQFQDRPTDLISCVRFAPVGPALLVASWDGELRIYDARRESASLYGSVKFSSPLLDAIWDTTRGSTTAYTAGIDQLVHVVDVENGKSRPIGHSHNAPVKALVFHKSTRSVISGSWDRTLQQIDVRTNTAEHGPTVQLSEKVISMDASPDGNKLVVATGGGKINIFDVRQLAEPCEQRNSSLKYPVRTIRCIPGAGDLGYISTSIEGRVAVDFFNNDPKPFAFKCHRIADTSGDQNAQDTVMPVNGLAFHPQFTTFYTGGSDGTVALWNYQTKKRVKGFPKYPSAVVALDVEPGTASMLAVGVSDDRYRESPESGVQPVGSCVYVRYLQADSR